MNSKSSVDSGWRVVMAARGELRGMRELKRRVQGVNNIVAVPRGAVKWRCSCLCLCLWLRALGCVAAEPTRLLRDGLELQVGLFTTKAIYNRHYNS
jgi:hypothetical protein